MKPKFSIIIPVYNVAPYLRECLDSILESARCLRSVRGAGCVVEIICVDDGSTDGSGTILDEFAWRDGRFRVIRQENAGVSAARNTGIDVATGEWICFLDGDDVVGPAWLMHYAEAMTEDVQIAFSGVEYAGRKLVGYDRVERGLKLTGELIAERRLLHSNFMVSRCFRKDFLRQIGVRFPEGIPFSEDMIFNYCVLNRAKAVSFAAGLEYHYRPVSGSASQCVRSPQEFLKAMHLAVGALEGPEGVFNRFDVPQDYRKDVLVRAFLGHVNRAIDSALKRKEGRQKVRSLLELSRSRPEICLWAVRRCCLLRRIWARLYLVLPGNVIYLIVRSSHRWLIEGA